MSTAIATDLEHSNGVTNPLVLLQAAIDKGVEPDRLGKLMDLVERWEANRAKREFADAMCAAQAEMPAVVKDAKGVHGTAYARLETVNYAIKPYFTKHGFSVSFREGQSPLDGHCRVVADVKHVGGHSEEHWLDVPLDGRDSKSMNITQGKGSTISYGRRYLTLMIFNVAVANEDNDAAGALDTLTPEEVQQIETLIVEKQADRRKFLQFAEVEEVADIRRKEFPKILDALKRKSSPKVVAQ